VYIDQHHVPRSLEPTLLLEARPVTRRRVRFSLAIAALIIANKKPSNERPHTIGPIPANISWNMSSRQFRK
jgi:hypothetical protein